MSVWNVCCIDELGSVNRGKSKHRPRNDVILFGGLYPFIQTADVKRANLYITEYNETYSDAGLAQSKLWKKGTLCITIAANIAESAILGIDACFPDSVVGFIPHKEVSDLKFVKYLLDEFKVYMQQISRGTTQDNLSLEKLRRVKFNVPDYITQQKIAHILSRYDEAIENNNKRIKLLEQMAQNLYKEWFVRFRFPGYENCEFENGIPVGWKVERLFDIANVTYGYAFASELFCEDKTLNPVVRIRDILYNQTNTCTSEVCADKYIIKEHEILVGMDGIFHMCMWNGKKAYQNQRVVKLTPKTEDISNYFLFLAVQPQVKFWEQTIAGTTVAHLGDKHLKRMTILLPSENLLKKSTKIFNSLMKQKNQLFIANENLAKQRDLLLPRLMSGKVEV
ncbi:MAG: restriction endonuclease subunit S [Spirochaetaceae bacterium]|nr:restriction endonuclease subunit S [Spirochaetaceae bacterium]